MSQTIPLRNSRLSVIQSEPSDEAPATMRFLDMLPEAQPSAGFGLLGGVAVGALRPLLAEVKDALREVLRVRETRVLALDHLAAHELAELKDLLAPGEVRGVAFTDARWELQESVIAGVWWVERIDSSGEPGHLHLEIGDVPRSVREAAATGRRALPMPPALPDGLMNAPPLLTEIAHEMEREHRTHNHVISFTLLPMNGADMRLLESVLGPGPVALESKGYGTCVVQGTGARGVWSVQHRNVMGEVVLDTLEVGDVPEGVLAANEDFEDSIIRIEELLEDAEP